MIRRFFDAASIIYWLVILTIGILLTYFYLNLTDD